jgi:hypothetical protein
MSCRVSAASMAALVGSWGEAENLINRRNAVWVGATRRISRLVVIAAPHGNQVVLFPQVDLYATSGSGLGGPAPVWLDVARGLRRWHLWHIRDAGRRMYRSVALPQFWLRLLPRCLSFQVWMFLGAGISLAVTGRRRTVGSANRTLAALPGQARPHPG